MRQIKFRGKSLHGGEWFYGNLFDKDTKGRTHISTVERGCLCIDPDTVGQFTGLTDCNGTEIYEGDVVTFDDTSYNVYSSPYTGEVMMYRGVWSVKHWSVLGYYAYAPLFRDDFADRKTKIEGNVFDNPDLLTDKLNEKTDAVHQ